MLFISYNFLNNVTFIIIYQNIKVIVISLYMCRLTKKKILIFIFPDGMLNMVDISHIPF